MRKSLLGELEFSKRMISDISVILLCETTVRLKKVFKTTSVWIKNVSLYRCHRMSLFLVIS